MFRTKPSHFICIALTYKSMHRHQYVIMTNKFLCFYLFCHTVQVYSVVDEMFLAGEIRETSQTKVLKQLLVYNSLE